MPAKSVIHIKKVKAPSKKQIKLSIFKADVRMGFDGRFMPQLYAFRPPSPNR